MSLIHFLISIYILILFISAVLSWLPTTSSHGGLASFKLIMARLTEPVLRPIRSIMPRPNFGGVTIDFSVIVAIILLEVINRVI